MTDTTAAAPAAPAAAEATTLVAKTEAFVRGQLAANDASHDFFHIERVRNTALALAKEEGIEDLEVVELGALLHDVGDWKYSNSDTAGIELSRKFLEEQKFDPERLEKVLSIIGGVSFSSELGGAGRDPCPELCVVQDADRLDAIGAIGIGRCFTYGGSHDRVMHDPDEKPKLGMTKEEYRTHKSSSINHFYEKLLTLKDKLKTDAGKRRAQGRHDFMLQFLEQFHAEWAGTR